MSMAFDSGDPTKYYDDDDELDLLLSQVRPPDAEEDTFYDGWSYQEAVDYANDLIKGGQRLLSELEKMKTTA
jgi:hypothetical protein